MLVKLLLYILKAGADLAIAARLRRPERRACASMAINIRWLLLKSGYWQKADFVIAFPGGPMGLIL